MKKFIILVLTSLCLLGCTPNNKSMCTAGKGTSTSASLAIYTKDDYIDYGVLTYTDAQGLGEMSDEYMDEMCSFLNSIARDCKIKTNKYSSSVTFKITREDLLFNIFTDVVDENGNVKFEDGIKVLEENYSFTCDHRKTGN